MNEKIKAANASVAGFLKDDEKKWLEEAGEKLEKKLVKAALRNEGKIPYISKDGHYDDLSESNVYWWTNGFYGGLLWQLYNVCEDGEIRKYLAKEARGVEEKLDKVFLNFDAMDHDAGFRWLPTAVMDYRMTGSREARNRGLVAAQALLGRWNPNGNFIRAWSDYGDTRNTGIVIIDSMMNLPLLYWASEEIGDPRFKKIALLHADTIMKNFIRENGSSIHIGEFDPETGKFIKEHGGQGFKDGSSWTRGQGWAIYGFTLSYLHTGEEKYLKTALRVADNFIKNIPEDGLIPVDFDQPKEIDYHDDCAAAIAVCGMLTIAGVLKEGNEKYYEAAMKLLHALIEKDSDLSEDTDPVLMRASAAYHDKNHDFPMLYADYYLVEAVWKLLGCDVMVW